jgi:hypothetical protein
LGPVLRLQVDKIALQFQRYLNATEAYQALEPSRLKISMHFTLSKKQSFYAISSALQGKAYLLHGL